LTLKRLQGKVSKSCYEAAKFSEETTAAEAAGQRRMLCGAVLRFIGSSIDVIGSAQTSPVNRLPPGDLSCWFATPSRYGPRALCSSPAGAGAGFLVYQ
jgi:hypothetical protein